MTNATAAPYQVARILYAIRKEGHFIGTPMVCIVLADPQTDGGELEGHRIMSASQVAEEALRVLGAKFRKCGVAHNEPYPARGAWAYIGGDGARWAELPALVGALQDMGFYVATETSPKAINHIGAGFDWICIAVNAEGNDVLDDAQTAEAIGVADELRFFIYQPRDVDFAISFCHCYPATEGQARTISVQAVGELNVSAQQECLSAALAWGWRVSFIPYPDLREPPRILSLGDIRRGNGDVTRLLQ